MPLGDWRYRTRVSREAQTFIEEHDELALPNTYVSSGEAAPYYPPSVRSFLFDDEDESSNGAAAQNGGGNGAGAG